jgi:hypothetical protein
MMNTLADLSKDAKLRAEVAKAFGVAEKALPKFSRKAAAKGAPAGTQEFQFVAPPEFSSSASEFWDKAGLGRDESLEISILIAGDAKGTWFAWSASENLAAEKLKAAQAGSGSTLQGRSGLGEFQTARVSSGGFASILGVEQAAMSRLKGSLSGAESLPNRGDTPFTFSSIVQKGSPHRLILKARAPKGVLVDLGQILQNL